MIAVDHPEEFAFEETPDGRIALHFLAAQESVSLNDTAAWSLSRRLNALIALRERERLEALKEIPKGGYTA